MDGPFYVDSRAPWTITDPSAVTIIATNLILLPLGNIPVLGSNYWWVGKAVRIRLFGRLTTAASAGTQTFSLWWGDGTPTGGTGGASVVASAAITMTNSMTSSSWRWDLVVRCRAIGTSGTLIANGSITFLNSATSTAAASEFMIPATANAAVTVDTTKAYVLYPQSLATTSTTNTMQVHEFSLEAIN